MKNTKVFLFCKTIHRYLVPLLTLLTILMVATGYFMNEGMYFGFDPITVRYMHGSASTFFALVLIIMTITGLYLFLFPYLPVLQSKRIPKEQESNSNMMDNENS